MTSAEVVAAVAVQTRWRATPGLRLIPLWRGRVRASDRPRMPYATLAVSKGVTPNAYQAPVTAGSSYVDYRLVEIAVYCTPAQRDRVAADLEAAFLQWPTLTTAGATFLSLRPVDPVSAAPDPATRHGEDVWKVTCRVELGTTRTH